MNDTVTRPLIALRIPPGGVAIVKPTEHTQKYLAHIRHRLNAATSERERAGFALIALALEASLKESK